MLPLTSFLIITRLTTTAAESNNSPYTSYNKRKSTRSSISSNLAPDLQRGGKEDDDPFGFGTPPDLKEALHLYDDDRDIGHDDDDDIGLTSSSVADRSESSNYFEDGDFRRAEEKTNNNMNGSHEDYRSNYDYSSDATAGTYTSSSWDDDDDVDMSTSTSSPKDALYDAYNQLHTLAQDFEKPFDAPAVCVVGHQSSGKSALIEALMGFQFNQVGGGTKTRRPIALRMQYNPQCTTPRCYLIGDDGVERPKSMADIQRYIEAENLRLERDPMRCFDSREINIRMEYKYCPNMILIDTPGLIAAPRLQRMATGTNANAQQRALWASAREAEKLVVQKMKCQDYIILCVEDTADWKHGHTREVVQKADPDLSRTVIVNTKLDTKVPQFGTPGDVEEFLRANIVRQLNPHNLGGPYFTSVPSGRVGMGQIFSFKSNEEFVQACAENEDSDLAVITQRLKMGLNDSQVSDLLPRVGLSNLRNYLEKKVDETYRRNVAKILPLLRTEHQKSSKKLAQVQAELDRLSPERLKAGAESFCDEFCKALKEVIHGSIKAPANIFGETIAQEHTSSGSFHEIPTSPLAIGPDTYLSLVDSEVGNTQHRLYGGAQYHRVLREFDLASKCMRLPVITEDEIANAAGVGETHDGVNFLRAACVISIYKAQASFEPFLDTLRTRCCHVMSKLMPVCEYIIRQKEMKSSTSVHSPFDTVDRHVDITQNPQFRQLVGNIYEQFVFKCSDSVMQRCKDDLHALTRFVTWDLRERSSGALSRSLPDSTDIVQVYQVALATNPDIEKQQKIKNNEGRKQNSNNRQLTERVSMPIDAERDERDYRNLLQLMEEAACSRDANRTNMVVGGLVQHIVTQWRESFGRQVVTKYNCFFLLPFVDEFQKYLRLELNRIYEDELSDIFDMTSARKQLLKQRSQLLSELDANEKLQDKFEAVSRMMRTQS